MDSHTITLDDIEAAAPALIRVNESPHSSARFCVYYERRASAGHIERWEIREFGGHGAGEALARLGALLEMTSSPAAWLADSWVLFAAPGPVLRKEVWVADDAGDVSREMVALVYRHGDRRPGWRKGVAGRDAGLDGHVDDRARHLPPSV